jgi:hypothetical protein
MVVCSEKKSERITSEILTTNRLAPLGGTLGRGGIPPTPQYEKKSLLGCLFFR